MLKMRIRYKGKKAKDGAFVVQQMNTASVMLISLLLAISVFSGCALAQRLITYEDALSVINEQRKQVGQMLFSKNRQLSHAAQNHATYLHRHNMSGHYESAGRKGFTGVFPIDRMLHAGYLSRHVAENASSHQGTASVADSLVADSVAGLMAAIYHRFGFLSFEHNEIGIGMMQKNQFNTFVYNMGNIQKNNLCRSPGTVNFGAYYFGICADKKVRVRASIFDELVLNVTKQNPPVVQWPAAGSTGIPPAFFKESPDPLPDHDVSGYPVSIQFNPAAFQSDVPRVTRFELFRQADNKKVHLIKRLDAKTDPHEKFTEYEHAIFPEDRLEWQTDYRVEATYTVGGKPHQLEWSFKTKDLIAPIHVLRDSNPVIHAKSGESFIAYFPPKSPRDVSTKYSTRYIGLTSVDIKIIDGNTLLIKVEGSRGHAKVAFNGRELVVKI